MKKVWLGILATMLVVVFVAPSYAWEFSMTGEFEYRLMYFGRTGAKDLFGDANVQNNPALFNLWGGDAGPIDPTTGLPPAIGGGAIAFGGYYPAAANSFYVGFAGPNIYRTGFSRHREASPNVAKIGVLGLDGPVLGDTAGAANVSVTRGGFSRYGSDALLNDQRLTFRPNIRVNNAIRVHGVYTVGGYRHKYAQTGLDSWGQNTSGVAPYERYYVSQTSDAAYNTAAIGSWEQVRATIQTPWATWSIGVKDFPFGTGATLANNTRAEAFLTVVPYGPFRFLHGIWLARGTKGGATSWWTVPDKDTKADIFQGLLMTYDNGPLHFGAGWIYQFNHANRYYGSYDPAYSAAGGNLAQPYGYDQNFNQFLLYSKYNNGRFFANAEYYWLTNDTTFIGHTPSFAEGYHAFAEAGCLCGPSKISLMYAQASGPVLNNNNVTRKFVSAPVNYQVLQPYSFLMFPTYGGGNDTFNADGTGEMGDALALAARLDYAAAANLNLYFTGMWARRLETAGYWGGGKIAAANSSATGNPTPNINSGLFTYPVNVGLSQNWKSQNAPGLAPANANPYPDDNLIGWELMGGVDWKLLENFTMGWKYAYWQPGGWFDQAYRAIGAQGLGLSGQGIIYGRDAIQAVQGTMTIDF